MEGPKSLQAMQKFAETYDGDDFINADNIINTNNANSEDNYDKDYIVYLKIK
jgi:hypothetical protein